MDQLEDILNEWQTNPRFRTHFKKNPEAALEKAGFKLSSSDLKKVKAALDQQSKNFPDERLRKRITK